MFLIYKSVSLIFILAASTCNLVSSDYIPVMLWNIKGNALHVKPASALGHNDKTFSESLKDVLQQESNIVVFAVNKLSLEDFSSDKPATMNNTLNNVEKFFDVNHYSLLSSVKDPLNYIHKAHCGVQEIVVDNKVDENVRRSISAALLRSCVVILHISDDGIILNEDELKSVFLPSFENSNQNIVGIFTGVKSSWGPSNTDRRTIRSLLQAPASDENNFLNYTGCIIMYAESASFIFGREQNDTVNLPFPPSLDGSSCDNQTETLQLTFTTTGAVTSVTLKFEFPQSRGSWKTVATLSAVGEKAPNEDVELDSSFIEAPNKFSFSCGDLVLNPLNKTGPMVGIRFKGFQIQPHKKDDPNEFFGDSFDCVTFFTIPIWMGIIVSLLFILITNIGVYALFSVRTMDRFDDPKGKTITVAATAD